MHRSSVPAGPGPSALDAPPLTLSRPTTRKPSHTRPLFTFPALNPHASSPASSVSRRCPARLSCSPASRGARKTDTILLLHTEGAIQTFSGHGQVKLGTDIAVAVGPVGREVAADARINRHGIAAGLSYSHAQGLYMGGSIAGEVLLTKRIDNEDFYRQKGITAKEILDGTVPRPDHKCAKELYELLDRVAGKHVPDHWDDLDGHPDVEE